MKIIIQCTLAALLFYRAIYAADEPTRPAMTDGNPAPGKFVKQVAAEYKNTGIYHALYLPTNWQAGKTYPVIVEYPPNQYAPSHSTGHVEDCRMGFYQSAGRDFI